jgi:hypothetical protein
MSTLAAGMVRAADVIEKLNRRYGLGDHCPWDPATLRNEAFIVASEERDTAGTRT